jgi:two-component system, NtrC family, sensor kinase
MSRIFRQRRRNFPEGSAQARELGFRAVLVVPLLIEGTVIGTIGLRRAEANPFTDRQVALLQTFADQAVIAIENVRLFKELQEKNGALTEALEQQTATSDILQTIAQAQTDVQPVFETIVRTAAQLCHAHTTAVFLTDGQMLYCPANYGISPEAMAAIRARFPRPLDRGSVTGTAILNRSVMHVPDGTAPLVPNQRHPRPIEDRGRADGAQPRCPLRRIGLAVVLALWTLSKRGRWIYRSV